MKGGWKNENGTITLVCGPSNRSVTMYNQVTLKQEGNNYYFLSNLQLPIDLSVITAKTITEEAALQNTSDADGQIYTTMLDEQNGYALRCSSPASGLMTKVLCKTSDGGASFGEYMDISGMRNYPCGVYFFTEDIGYIITDYHCSDAFLYRTEDGGKTWYSQTVYIPGDWYRYVNGISIEKGILQIQVVLDDTSMYYEYITNDMGETWDRTKTMRDPIAMMQDDDVETISYNGKKYNKSKLCDATLRWLELSEEERLLSSYFPPEFMNFVENWGVTLAAENITPTGLTLKCTQSGANPIGELQTGSWYILEEWTQEYGWMEVDYLPQEYEPVWTQESWMVPMNGSCEWEVNWEWLYGSLPAGKYRIGKNIMDFRGTGNYDNSIYFVEFEITQ